MHLTVLLLLATATQDSAEHLFLSAARSGDVGEVRALLAAGTDVDGTDPDGRTALMVAAGRNDGALVELLLEAGADAGKRDAEGVSALTIAKAEGFPDIIARLRSAGARESQEELLDEAVRAGDLDAVARLLDDGADANALDTDDYQTPLMTALELRELEILLRLVQAGADPTREGTGIQTSGENDISVAARQSSAWALRGLLQARARQADLDGAYCGIEGTELFLYKMHIARYAQAGHFGHEPRRSRKLLAHNREIQRLVGRLAQRGYALVPLSVYFKKGRAKVELGMGKGRKQGDDRESIKRKLDLREARNAMGRARGR